MKAVLIVLVAALLIAHQDYWNWTDASLVWGFLPVGLFHHLCISLAAGLVWWLAVTFAWPRSFTELDASMSELARQESKLSRQQEQSP